MATRPLDKEWAEVKAYVEDIFFTDLNEKIEGVAVDLADEIEKSITKQLDTFFSNLANMFGNWANGAPDWVLDTNGEWQNYAYSYADFKQVKKRGSRDFFVLREMAPAFRGKSNLDRYLRRQRQKRDTKTRKKGQLKGPSLKQEIKSLANPSKYWGRPLVLIESHTNTRGRDGKRRYNKGVTRMGSHPGGRIMNIKGDFVTLHVEWLPALSGLDVLERGITEEPAAAMGKGAGASLPHDVIAKLMNREMRNDGKLAYRPLLGPYMLWYQDTTVRQVMRKTALPYGPQL
jgi:hypothetical protein